MYLFDTDFLTTFDTMHIQSMTLTSSSLQIQKHENFGDLNIVICVAFCNLLYYAINMDGVNLFTYISFLANLHCIDVIYQFE